MGKIITVLLIALVFEALGVVLLKSGIDQITAQEKAQYGDPIKVSRRSVLRLIGHGFINSRVLVGVLFEAIFFAGLLILMGHKDISFVWPLTSLSMVFATAAAVLLLKEKVTGTRWIGVILMMIGAALITWSEQKKDAEQKRAEAMTATANPR